MSHRVSGEPVWAQPAVVMAIAVGYCLAHALLRYAFSATIGIDDVDENIYSQSLEWGYIVRNPPLYNWILWLTQRVTGPGIASFLLVKYGALLVTARLLYAISMRVTNDRKMAALTVFSLGAVYQIGWNYHEGVTHTAILMAAVAASYLAFMRFVEHPNASRGVLLGLAVGVGMLSKHSYLATLLVIILAAVATPSVRGRLAGVWLGLALMVAVVLYSPYLLWVNETRSGIGGSFASVSDVALRSKDRLLLYSLVDALVKPVIFLSPLVLIMAVYVRLWRAGTGVRRDPDWLGFLRAVMLFGVAGLVAGVLFTGITEVKERHLHPLFLIAVVWLWAELGVRVATGQSPPPSHKLSLRLFAGLAAAILLIRAVSFVAPDAVFCGKNCRQMKPYGVLGQTLRENGAGTATLVAADFNIGGNLRRLFPEARIVPFGNSNYTPPIHTLANSCWLVWDVDAKSKNNPVPAGGTGQQSDTIFVTESWPHVSRPEGWKLSRFAFRSLQTTDPLCRAE